MIKRVFNWWNGAMIAILAGMIVFSGCNEKEDVFFTDQTLCLSVNGYELNISLEEYDAYYNVKTLNTEFPNTFELLSKRPNVSVSVDEQKLSPNGLINVKIDRIAYDNVITVTIKDEIVTRKAYIRTLNSNIPTYTAVGESPYKGDYYVTHLVIPMMLKLNQSGEIVYYLCANEYMPNIQGDISNIGTLVQVMSYWDFKKHVLPSGEVLYSYHEQNPTFNRLNLSGYAGGDRVIMDEKYNEIKRIKMVTNDNSSINALDGHDFYLIDADHYIVSGYELKLVHNIPEASSPHPQGSKVIASHIQEVKNGVILLDWYSTNYPELYGLSEANNNDYINQNSQQSDYAHFNSVDIDPNDGNLVFSFRHLSTILKIDRKNGNIIWKLSGEDDQFGLTALQNSSDQHYARFTKDGYISIFDNNLRYGKSRVIKLKIDESNKRLVDWHEYIVPGHFSVACGSAMNLEKEVFVIGWGYSTDDLAAMTEIDFGTGRKLFELTFPKGLNLTYRCMKF
jgi:hypothetical protein